MRGDQRTRWTRFLDTLLPAPSPDRLVPVTDVPRAMVPFAEECPADVEIGAVIRGIAGTVAPASGMPGGATQSRPRR
jgi:hypothetical protein